MTETILFGELSYEVGKRLLGDETEKRLNPCRSGFGFKCYNTKVPGFVCIPVSFSATPAEKKEQVKELKKLGYKRMKDEEVKLYGLGAYKTEIYMISVEALMKAHKVTI